MKIAIQYRVDSFAEDWVDYCKTNGIEYKLVDCIRDGVENCLNDCDIFAWHWNYALTADALSAKAILAAAEDLGLLVFPDTSTSLHYNSKIAQKYIFDALKIVMPETKIFFDKDEALKWKDDAKYPIVFKMSGGAGSRSVFLLKNKSKATKVIKKAFGKGFEMYPRESLFDAAKRFLQSRNTENFNRLAKLVFFPIKLNWEARKNLTNLRYLFHDGKISFMAYAYDSLIQIFASMFIPPIRDRGYVYFQKFMPGNKFDIRVVVAGNKAVAIKRLVRVSDFRASGSGRLVYNHLEIPKQCIEIAFQIKNKLSMQLCAIDLVYDFECDRFLCTEVSLGFSRKAYRQCDGFWTEDLVWHDGNVSLQQEVLASMIAKKGESGAFE